MRPPARILIAEDELAFRETVVETLRDAGYHVDEAGDGEQAWRLFRAHGHNVVISDIRMPGCDGLVLLDRISQISPSTPVIMITAYGSVETAIEALRRGAHDYIMKPCDLDELKIRVDRVLDRVRLERKVEGLTRDERITGETSIIGNSPSIATVKALIAKVGPTLSTVLITGESGTGKELVAREIHRMSGRDPFLPINCGAIPEQLMESELFGHRKGSFTGATTNKDGLFRLADGGTLFLDEIGELPLSLQAKLLRALDSGEIQPIGAPGPIATSARIVAATNRNLEEEVKEKRFREDLYFRLNVIELKLPPLRERPGDIEELARKFVANFAKRHNRSIDGMDESVFPALSAYPWRGNIREMQNILERAVILCDGTRLTLSDLPAVFALQAESTHSVELLEEAVADFEKSFVEQTIARSGGDKRKAAQKLGIGLSSLYRKLGEKSS